MALAMFRNHFAGLKSDAARSVEPTALVMIFIGFVATKYSAKDNGKQA